MEHFALIEKVAVPEDWPRDPANGRLLCSPERQKPENAAGLWAHTNVRVVGGCSDGCCDDFQCRDCGEKWRSEGAD